VKFARRSLAIALMAILVAARAASGATISTLLGPDDFLSPVTSTNDFEAGEPGSVPLDTAEVSFAGSPKLALALKWTGGNTPSGQQGLVEDVDNEPMRIVFSTPVHEVGMFFGNDDFGRLFYATLELFDDDDASLGTVRVRSNGNDFADQFIGARSGIAVKSAALSYERPSAHLLSIYIDDLIIGSAIPEPVGVALVVCAVISVLVACRTRQCLR
jgi:hypothetical protein